MAVSGLPESCENHAKWIAKLALDMMDMAKYVQMGAEPVVRQTLIPKKNNIIFQSHFVDVVRFFFLFSSVKHIFFW